jgi:hypothetical protein
MCTTRHAAVGRSPWSAHPKLELLSPLASLAMIPTCQSDRAPHWCRHGPVSLSAFNADQPIVEAVMVESEPSVRIELTTCCLQG